MALNEITNAKIYYALESDRPIDTTGFALGSLVIFTDSLKEESFDGVNLFSRKVENGAVKTSLPQNSSGMLTVNELPSTLTAATTYTVDFPAGLKGVKVKFIKVISAAVASICYVGFNKTSLNDVTIPGLRDLIEITGEEVYTFDSDNLPTQMTLVVNKAEVTTGDSLIYFKAVQQS